MVEVEEACRKIKRSLRNHYAQLKEATSFCIKDLSCQLYANDLISKPVRDSPTYENIVDEMQAGLAQIQYFVQLRLHYERFLDCLSAQGGPSKKASDQLYREWKDIKEEFEELDSREERRKRTELITNKQLDKQLDEYFKQRDKKYEIVEEEIERLKFELKRSQEENRQLLERAINDQEKPMMISDLREKFSKQQQRIKELERGETEKVRGMKEEMQLLRAQNELFEQDFRSERNDRERINDQLIKLQEQYAVLKQECHQPNSSLMCGLEKVDELNERLANEIKSKQQLDNELAMKKQQLYHVSRTNQQLDNELARMRQQLDDLSADKEELLRAYHEERAMVTRLEDENERIKQANEMLLDKVKPYQSGITPATDTPWLSHNSHRRYHENEACQNEESNYQASSSVREEYSMFQIEKHSSSVVFTDEITDTPHITKEELAKLFKPQQQPAADYVPPSLIQSEKNIDEQMKAQLKELELVKKPHPFLPPSEDDVISKQSGWDETKDAINDDDDDRPPVCPKCGKQFCVGEVQKLKRHINEFCTGIRMRL